MNSTNDVSGIKNHILNYFRHWKWFVVTVLMCILMAWIYLRYATPKYAATAKIQIFDEKGGGAGLDLFKELEIFSGGKNPVEDEIQVINSRSNFIEVVKELGLNTRISAVGS